MNQGRIWCVVKPTVGLPLFLGTVLVDQHLFFMQLVACVSFYLVFCHSLKDFVLYSFCLKRQRYF